MRARVVLLTCVYSSTVHRAHIEAPDSFCDSGAFVCLGSGAPTAEGAFGNQPGAKSEVAQAAYSCLSGKPA